MPKLGLKRIKGICLADNMASRKVMERCGFVKEFEGPGPYQGQEREICRFYFVLS
jgi:RimJ/RimL family protein N-acetyltransferase